MPTRLLCSPLLYGVTLKHMQRHLLNTVITFYTHDVVSGVLATATCPSICLSLRPLQPILYQND